MRGRHVFHGGSEVVTEGSGRKEFVLQKVQESRGHPPIVHRFNELCRETGERSRMPSSVRRKSHVGARNDEVPEKIATRSTHRQVFEPRQGQAIAEKRVPVLLRLRKRFVVDEYERARIKGDVSLTVQM